MSKKFSIKTKIIELTIVFIVLFNLSVSAQSIISGTVTDSLTNKPVSGASVTVLGTNIGTLTNGDGKFNINAKKGATLAISFVGYATKDILISNGDALHILLAASNAGLNDVVVVGYGTQSKRDVTGSIATVQSKDITTAPVSNVADAMVGRLPGLVAQQQSGYPGNDVPNLSIRGFGSALVIVDGVESAFTNIDPNDIESISVLKDGAASIYGSRAGNGVILVTTKRGKMGKPTISYNPSYTLQGVTYMPKPASAGQYAEMQSEAWVQSGKPDSTAPYTPEQIQKYYEGTDPLYPNTNWYNVLIRNWAPQQLQNVSVRGGSDKIKYFASVGYASQETMWRNNGGKYQRYNVQSNVDAKILDNLTLEFDLSSVYEDRDFPWRGENVWQDFWTTLPIYPATLPDPTKVSFANGQGTGGAQVTTNEAISGYDRTGAQNLKGTLALTYDVKQIEGLSAKAFVNISQDYSFEKHFTKPVNFYTYDPQSDTYTLAGSLGSTASLSQTDSKDKEITTQLSLNYDHSFGDHHVQGLVLYENIDYGSDVLSASRVNFLTPVIDQMFAGSTTNMTNNGSATEMGRESYLGRINYAYKEKYLLEGILRADASAKFPPNKRWGYFPSVSAGWRISQEGFMKNFKNLDDLKFRLSYGQAGNDNVGDFQYLAGYQYGLTYILDNTTLPGIVSTGLANPDLTWERITTYNAGLDFSFLKRAIYGSGDVFYRTRRGIPATRVTTLPSTFGATLPPENINSLNDRGFELSLGTSGGAGKLTWDVSANISYTMSKWDHYEEPEYTDPDQKRIYQMSGRQTDIAFGYKSAGLFTSQEQIDNLGFDEDGQGNKTLRPGDIRYVDENHDGVLDWKDQVVIGKGTVPHWMYGFNMNLKFENFDLSALFQGAFGYYNDVILQHALLVPAIVYDLRWTQQNDNPNALVPRLGGASTDNLPSDYYYKNVSYIRLKSLSIGYNLPKQLLEKINLSQIRIYLAGTNLFTLNTLSKYGIDPEAPSGLSAYYYPQMRTISVGANISF